MFLRRFDLTAHWMTGLLLGTVLADRYLGRRYRSTSDELSDWLTQYRDFPDAGGDSCAAADAAAEGCGSAAGAGDRRTGAQLGQRADAGGS